MTFHFYTIQAIHSNHGNRRDLAKCPRHPSWLCMALGIQERTSRQWVCYLENLARHLKTLTRTGADQEWVQQVYLHTLNFGNECNVPVLKATLNNICQEKEQNHVLPLIFFFKNAPILAKPWIAPRRTLTHCFQYALWWQLSNSRNKGVYASLVGNL